MKKEYFAGLIIVVSCLFLMAADSEDIKSQLNVPDTLVGGRLYDKWYAVKSDAKKPETVHPLYPKEGKASRKPANTWRCKECHGWDYKGKDGAYASGSHFTGIEGLRHLEGLSPLEVLKKFNLKHKEYQSILTVDDKKKISQFLSKGNYDMGKHISPKTKLVKKGNPKLGETYYKTLCAQCHGATGTEVKDMPDLRTLSLKNPWESLHKILNGQPGKKMPALGALDKQISLDILTYLQQKDKVEKLKEKQ